MHVLDMLRSYLLRLLADKGLSTKFVIEEGLEGKSFLTDRKKLTQAISNFYNNAIKFTDKGGVILSCSLKNDRLRIEVSDSGPGISQEDQKKLFKKFSQIDSSNTKDFKGSGLGLNITQELIELMNGKVGVTAMKELIKSGKKIPPVFAVTANAMEGDRDKYLSLGFSSYIAKPFKKDEILKHLALHFSEGLD